MFPGVLLPALLLLWSAALLPSDAVGLWVTSEAELYEAVTLLESGQNILIDMESVLLTKRLDVTATRVKIIGRSTGTELRCPQKTNIMLISGGGVELENLHFVGCKTASALKIDTTSSKAAQNTDCCEHSCAVHIRRCRFERNYAGSTFRLWSSTKSTYYGGAIHAIGTHVLISNCHFAQNFASYGGAIYIAKHNESFLEVYETRFLVNRATNRGGAIYGYTEQHIYSSRFVDNDASYGGAIIAYATEGRIYNCDFVGGTVAASGGALYVDDKSDFVVEHSRFLVNNASTSGGALFVLNSQMRVDKCVFIHNEAKQAGGAIYAYNNAQLKVTDSEFVYNVAIKEPTTDDIRYPSGKALT